MEKEDIHLDDIKRILFGNAPPEFLLEVAVRTLIVYSALVIIVRLLGKRTNAMLTITERAVFITLGAMISQPMQGPPNGIVLGIIALICILTFQRLLTLSFLKNAKWQNLMQGKMHLIVKDSVLDIDKLYDIGITRNQLFEVLRSKKIRHLGQVKRVYLEACGIFSIYSNENPAPGLSILREEEQDLMVKRDESLRICGTCGLAQQQPAVSQVACSNCGEKKWTNPSKEYVHESK
jgi:uncharacterized membrane protein YcaP (DUF421 family)